MTTQVERIPVPPQPKADPLSTALVPILTPEHFAHVVQEFRGKVARDLKAHLTAENRWDYSQFNALNDYQRHLYALFLRLADVPYKLIWGRMWDISVDVSRMQRERYVEDVLYSSIVGFTAPSVTPKHPLGVAL